MVPAPISCDMNQERKRTSATPAPPPDQPPVPVAEFQKPTGETEDERLLSRERTWLRDPEVTTDSWRVFRIMGEFVEGFDTLARVGPAVSVFGSARVKRNDPHYRAAEELGGRLVQEGFAVIT